MTELVMDNGKEFQISGLCRVSQRDALGSNELYNTNKSDFNNFNVMLNKNDI